LEEIVSPKKLPKSEGTRVVLAWGGVCVVILHTMQHQATKSKSVASDSQSVSGSSIFKEKQTVANA